MSLDPNANTRSPDAQFYSILYSQLLKLGKTTDGSYPTSEMITGDAAESFEFTPDGMQLTLKLRQNHKFDPRPPTNGRAMTVEDIRFSWDRQTALSPFAADMLNAKNAYGPIQSLTTPDDGTIVIKLAFPYRGILDMLAFHTYFWIVPQEAERFNIKAEARGSGPFFLKEWKPSLGLDYTKNPDWYVKGRPFLDGIQAIILPDYPAGLAQFESGALWNFTVNQEDILRVKNDHPEMVITKLLGEPPQQETLFGMNASSREDSPLRDVRLRQAASMLIDRDLIIDATYNTNAFQNAGIPSQIVWANHLGAGSANILDPRTGAIGEGQKYFQYNVAEARKLMSAAGYDKAKQLSFWSRGANTGGATGGTSIPKLQLLLGQMLTEGGFGLDEQGLDIQTQWRQTCQLSPTVGQGWSGWCHYTAGGFDEAEKLVAKYTPEGKFRLTYQPIPGITDLARKARVELDGQRKSDMIKQLQRELALLWLDLPPPGYSDAYRMSWPWLKNYGVFNQIGNQDWSSARIRTEYWYDPSERKTT